MKRERSKAALVNGPMCAAWVGAGLEVPVAEFDRGIKATRTATTADEKRAAAELKRRQRALRRWPSGNPE